MKFEEEKRTSLESVRLSSTSPWRDKRSMYLKYENFIIHTNRVYLIRIKSLNEILTRN